MFAAKIMSQTAEVVEIQLLSPPENKVNFGKDDKGIAIVAIHYSISSETSSLDSILVNTVADGIRETLEYAPIFENVPIFVYNIYSDASMMDMDMPLDELDAIAEQTGVSAVVAIEFVDIKASYIFGKSKQIPLFTQVDVAAKINIYDVYTGEKMMKYNGKDNIVIPTSDENSQLVSVPKLEDARIFTAKIVGTDFAKRITPTWETVERLVFFDWYSDRAYTNLNKAYTAAMKRQDWSTAAQYWTDALSENVSKLRQAQIMYNLALSCEMLEKFDLALKWLEKAKALRTRIDDSIDEYTDIIKQRITDRAKLDTIFFN